MGATPLRFDQKLVLNRWILSLFQEVSFEALARDLKDPALEGLDYDNTSMFCRQLVNRFKELERLPHDDLLRYDANIVRHTASISARRPEPVRWKYFQYLGLLFTEIFLERYFRDRQGLLDELNQFRDALQARKQVEVEPYALADLQKLAFWSATGSGKTLLMHVNLLQYKHYLHTLGNKRDLDRVILLTPNEGLSLQHLGEFEESGIHAEIFRSDAPSLFRGQAVEIIEVTKLKEQMGTKTVAIEAFEGNNLVLVDEAHRGNKDDGVWRSMRNRLAETGFAFEYSATFSQTIRASGSKALENEYAKCILFDYSYKYFYGDGYGKDYRILNLPDDRDEGIRNLYLTACLLSFFQQLRLFQDKPAEFARFNIERPLAIFVGGKVNAVNVERGREVSDVTTVLHFFKRFIDNEGKASYEQIRRLLGYDKSLLDQQGRPVFGEGAFEYLNSLGLSPEEIFQSLLQTVFNAPFRASLHVDLLKGSDGELVLRVGENEPFGVINVGDAPKLLDLCTRSGLNTSERQFGGSVFARLNDKSSMVNVLMGSRKFTEGWSSWRVSTMGLMNIGRSEGSQIIQLFGRGVRLKGHEMSLKRSSAMSMQPLPPWELRYLETLNVFGVRADYMQQFKEMLEAEGVTTDEMESIEIPTLTSLDSKKLKVVGLKPDADFKRKGTKPTLGAPIPGLGPVSLNWYSKIQVSASKGAGGEGNVHELEKHKLTPEHTAFFNVDEIWFELQRFKAEKSLYNLNLPREAVEELIRRDDWYTLYIPEAELAFTSFERVRRWQEIMVALLKKYTERFYFFRKSEYEKDYIEYRELSSSDSNFIEQYQIWVDKSRTEAIREIKALKDLVDSGKLGEEGWKWSSLVALGFSRHLYRPLIHVGDNSFRVTPTPLNGGEKDFVEDLRTFFLENSDYFEEHEMYLLRNMSRGRGIGFFEAGNFHPDFILWVIHEDKQYVTFVDPKGIRNLAGPTDPKITFGATIKELEARLGDPTVILNSFIVSMTPFSAVGWWTGEDRQKFEEMHVIFRPEQERTYIGKIFDRITRKQVPSLLQ